MRGFYFITDSNLSLKGNIFDVRSAVSCGVKFIQYREKNATTSFLYREALILKKICKGAKFIINDRVDIALAVDADGVHLGKDDLPIKVARKLLGKYKIIGVSVKSVKDAIYAQKQSADYVSIGPIFFTKTKENAHSPVGISIIKEIKKNIDIPLVAIGGINLENAKSVIEAGADCICAISAVVGKPNLKEIIKKFNSLFK